MKNSLTWEAIEQAYEAIQNQLYPLLYATSEQCQREGITIIGPKWCPELVVFHPLDFDMISNLANNSGYRLVKAKNYLWTEMPHSKNNN